MLGRYSRETVHSLLFLSCVAATLTHNGPHVSPSKTQLDKNAINRIHGHDQHDVANGAFNPPAIRNPGGGGVVNHAENVDARDIIDNDGALRNHNRDDVSKQDRFNPRHEAHKHVDFMTKSQNAIENREIHSANAIDQNKNAISNSGRTIPNQNVVDTDAKLQQLKKIRQRDINDQSLDIEQTAPNFMHVQKPINYVVKKGKSDADTPNLLRDSRNEQNHFYIRLNGSQPGYIDTRQLLENSPNKQRVNFVNKFENNAHIDGNLQYNPPSSVVLNGGPNDSGNRKHPQVQRLPLQPHMAPPSYGDNEYSIVDDAAEVQRLDDIPVVREQSIKSDAKLSSSHHQILLDGYNRNRLNRQNNKFRSSSSRNSVNYSDVRGTSKNRRVPPVRYDGKDFSINLSDVEFKIRRAPVASTGHPWPLPQYYRLREDKVYTIDADTFTFNLLSPQCDIITEALKRYHLIITEFTIRDMHDNLEHAPGQDVENEESKYNDPLYKNATTLASVNVKVRSKCDSSYPPVSMDETYNILILNGKATISANEVWGLLRGLETFSQVVFRGTDNKLYVRDLSINDYPRFSHRGILFDTARHYMFKDTFFDVLDAMAANKMNVLHWHMVDDQSFPFESKVYPKLSKKGAFHPDMVYTHADIKEIVDFARLRGIRVIPELDTPGHTYSWGLGYPHLLTQCYDGDTIDERYLGPLNPALNSTFRFLHKLLREITQLFPDKMIHLGGDEVPLTCWSSNPDLAKFSNKLLSEASKYNGDGSFDAQNLMKYYETRLMKEFHRVQQYRAEKQRPVFWQEVMDTVDGGVSQLEDLKKETYTSYEHNESIQEMQEAWANLPQDAIMHVWKGGVGDIQRAVSKGHDVIFSSCWYLDMISFRLKWEKYYTCEPTTEPQGEELINEKKLLGGEAAIWAEYIDNEQLMPYLWPRASPAAERLWSNKNVRSMQDASIRLQEQRCRMLGRGLSVSQISGPDYCPSRGPRKNPSASALWANRMKERSAKREAALANRKVAVRIPLGVDSNEATLTPQARGGPGRIDFTWSLVALIAIIIAVIIVSRHRNVAHISHRLHFWRNKSLLAVFVTMVYVTSFITIRFTAIVSSNDLDTRR